ncbi:MFS transporter [Streptomyces sp. NPDC055400]
MTWALSAEYAPRRFRVTGVSIIMVGYTLGGAAGGPLSNLLVPDHGWRSVFVLGGVCSLLTVVAVWICVPESVKFLAVRARGGSDERIARILHRLQPGLDLAQGTRFTTGDHQQQSAVKGFALAALFRGPLVRITPLLWLVYLLSSALIYFMVFWTPMINEGMGFSVDAAATIAAAASVAGAFGQFAISRFVDRKGAGVILWMPLAAVVCMLTLGLGALAPTVYVVVVISAKMFINGGHGGITSIAGTFYPTAVRANGAAWASSVAKVGAMIGYEHAPVTRTAWRGRTGRRIDLAGRGLTRCRVQLPKLMPPKGRGFSTPSADNPIQRALARNPGGSPPGGIASGDGDAEHRRDNGRGESARNRAEVPGEECALFECRYVGWQVTSRS